MEKQPQQKALTPGQREALKQYQKHKPQNEAWKSDSCCSAANAACSWSMTMISLQVCDLSQKSKGYLRTETEDGALMTLKKNTCIYSMKKQRVMTNNEISSSLVLPCTKASATKRYIMQRHAPILIIFGALQSVTQEASKAKASKAPFINISDLTDSRVRCLTGNGMSVPCAGVLVLITALFVEKTQTTKR